MFKYSREKGYQGVIVLTSFFCEIATSGDLLAPVQSVVECPIGVPDAFCTSIDCRGELAAVMHSLIGTAKLNGLDPERGAAKDLADPILTRLVQPIRRIRSEMQGNAYRAALHLKRFPHKG
jgi:hypothetical protein